MASQPPPFEQQHRQREQPQDAPPREAPPQSQPIETQQSQPSSEAADARLIEEQTAKNKKIGFRLEPAKLTAGRTGERNIQIQWIDVWVGNAKPSRFVVKTAPANGLEVVMQQRSYNRSFTGTGTVSTPITPVAPIGTKGKLTVRDTTTGEVTEQPWTWHSMGGGGGGGLGLWEIIKRLFVKPSE